MRRTRACLPRGHHRPHAKKLVQGGQTLRQRKGHRRPHPKHDIIDTCNRIRAFLAAASAPAAAGLGSGRKRWPLWHLRRLRSCEGRGAGGGGRHRRKDQRSSAPVTPAPTFARLALNSAAAGSLVPTPMPPPPPPPPVSIGAPPLLAPPAACYAARKRGPASLVGPIRAGPGRAGPERRPVPHPLLLFTSRTE